MFIEELWDKIANNDVNEIVSYMQEKSEKSTEIGIMGVRKFSSMSPLEMHTKEYKDELFLNCSSMFYNIVYSYFIRYGKKNTLGAPGFPEEFLASAIVDAKDGYKLYCDKPQEVQNEAQKIVDIWYEGERSLDTYSEQNVNPFVMVLAFRFIEFREYRIMSME